MAAQVGGGRPFGGNLECSRYGHRVTIRRQPRDHEGIGSLKLISALGVPTSALDSAGESANLEALMHWLVGGVRASLANPSRLHGLRVEAMFAAVLVALGHFRLLVEEDAGQLYYDDADGPVKLPDYRVVDAEGRPLLVEVKAVRPNPGRLRHSIPADEAHALRRYGRLTGAPVAVAHYWSAANLWTLVDLEKLQLRGEKYELELVEAIKFNEMGRFGDRTLGTVPPLELHLEVEQLGERGADDAATVVIRNVQLRAAGHSLLDEVERQIAFLMFRYGGWEVETPAELDATGRVTSFALRAAPPEEARELVERQGTAIVGALSSMYSAMFNEMTLDDDGAVQRLDNDAEPGELGSLIPSDYFERSNRQLQLCVLHVQPNESDEAGHA